MGYSYEGYYVDPVSLREFAAKTAPETPPGEALNRLYSGHSPLLVSGS